MQSHSLLVASTERSTRTLGTLTTWEWALARLEDLEVVGIGEL
ncbi:MAG: hypothetical protein AAF802_25875 [Planctomycetota bacterium]